MERGSRPRLGAGASLDGILLSSARLASEAEGSGRLLQGRKWEAASFQDLKVVVI